MSAEPRDEDGDGKVPVWRRDQSKGILAACILVVVVLGALILAAAK